MEVSRLQRGGLQLQRGGVASRAQGRGIINEETMARRDWGGTQIQKGVTQLQGGREAPKTEAVQAEGAGKQGNKTVRQGALMRWSQTSLGTDLLTWTSTRRGKHAHRACGKTCRREVPRKMRELEVMVSTGAETI